MADLVVAKFDKTAKVVGREFAEAADLEVLEDEPTHTPDGRLRDEFRLDGRPMKQQTTVAKSAAAKAKSADNEKERTDDGDLS